MSGPCVECGAASVGLIGGVCPQCAARRGLGEMAGGEGFAGHELITELGRGGAGVVYLARHIDLDRLVALKILAPGIGADPAAADRFLREAREAARLRHPHIVAIHEIGRHGEQPFFSMEYVEGDALSLAGDRLRKDLRTAAKVVAQAALAIQYAHSQGVLHRDLKPSNLIVDSAGEPHVIDFGLARAIEGSDGLTRTGEIMGSPGFLAPEQLRGEASPATDVYGLGGVLYFLLTGRAPFVAALLPELLIAVAASDPLAPRRLDPSLPRDLETIVLRALAHDPTRRYASAADLAADLENWRAGRPIQARPVSSAERAWRWAQRNRRIAALAGALVVALLVGGGGIFFEWRRAESAAASQEANLYAADLKLASDALQGGDLGTARRTLQGCPRGRRDGAWGLLWTQAQGEAEAEVGRSDWTVTDLTVSPDGKVVATAAQVDLVKLWDTSGGRLIAALPGTGTSWWVAYSPDGRRLFTADQKIKEWDVAAQKVLREFPGMTGVLSSDGSRLFTCAGHPFVFEGEPGPVIAWDLNTGERLFSLPIAARLLALSPDGRTLAVSDAETTITLYDARDGRPLGTAWAAQGRLWHLAFSPDGKWFAGSGWSPSVRVWNTERPEQEPRRLVHPLNTWTAIFSPDGSELAVAGSDRLVHVWDTTSWTERRVWRGHEHEVWSLAWPKDGRLLSAGRDPRVLRWPIGPAEVAPAVRHDPHSYRIVWLPGGRIATVHEADGRHGDAQITDLTAPRDARSFAGEIPLAYDSAGRRLWLWSHQGDLIVRRIDAPDPRVVVPWPLAPGDALVGTPHPVPTAEVAWAQLADGSLEIRRLTDGHPVSRTPGVFAPLENLPCALSPDGQWFVWGGHSTELQLLNLVTGQRTRLDGHRYEVSSIVFAPDGESFVSGGADGLLFSWETAPPHRRRELGRHVSSVGQMAISPDGRILAAQEGGIGIRLWHLATGREVGFLPLPDDGNGEWLGFSPEGDRLAMRRGDGVIQFFAIAPPTAG